MACVMDPQATRRFRICCVWGEGRGCKTVRWMVAMATFAAGVDGVVAKIDNVVAAMAACPVVVSCHGGRWSAWVALSASAAMVPTVSRGDRSRVGTLCHGGWSLTVLLHRCYVQAQEVRHERLNHPARPWVIVGLVLGRCVVCCEGQPKWARAGREVWRPRCGVWAGVQSAL